MGILLYVTDKNSESSVSLEKMNFKSSFLIGISQALAAAFPGVSRSGITMTVARYLKVDRESAAKYSFLLSGPMVAAAVLVSIKDFTFLKPLNFYFLNNQKTRDETQQKPHRAFLIFNSCL